MDVAACACATGAAKAWLTLLCCALTSPPLDSSFLHGTMRRWEAATERFLDVAEPASNNLAHRLEAGFDNILHSLHNTLTGGLPYGLTDISSVRGVPINEDVKTICIISLPQSFTFYPPDWFTYPTPLVFT